MSAYLEQLEDGPRCKRWNLILSVGSGKDRKRKSKAFVGGKREALAALKEFEQETHIPLEQSGFKSFANRWNDNRLKSGAIAESTHDKYKWFIATVSPYLDLPLESIRPGDIQAAYAALSGSWSGTSLRSLHNSLTRIFRAAQDEGFIGSTPMVGVDAPKIDTKESKALSPTQAAGFLSELDVSDHRQFAISLILRCGLRRGEVCGLEWRDVGSSIHVRREITKSDSGVRDIPLDEETRKLIAARKIIVKDALKSVHDKLNSTDKLCCGIDGRPMTGDVLRRWWERNRDSFGLEGFTIHELRHTFLTNLAQAGVHPSVMQKLAGHSSMSTTMKIYTHVHNEDLQEAIALLASARKSARTPKTKKAGQNK